MKVSIGICSCNMRGTCVAFHNSHRFMSVHQLSVVTSVGNVTTYVNTFPSYLRLVTYQTA